VSCLVQLPAVSQVPYKAKKLAITIIGKRVTLLIYTSDLKI
jgi:hypothetical protein